ncbi:MAG: hypothetical protein ACI4ED_07060 [Suilimivivens sp.]
MNGHGKLLLLAAVLLVSQIMGCGMRRDFERDKMMTYMRRKYGEEFTYVESYAGQAGKSYTMILVKSRAHSDFQALVRLSEREGKRYYEDNYLAYLLREDLEQIIGDYAKMCFGDCKIYYKIPTFVFPFYFKADMTPESFLGNPCSMPQFYIYPKNRDLDRKEWEEKMQDFRELNAKAGYKIRGTLSLAATEEAYEGITEVNFAMSDYEGYEAWDELLFSMDEKGNFRYLRWLSGKSA